MRLSKKLVSFVVLINTQGKDQGTIIFLAWRDVTVAGSTTPLLKCAKNRQPRIFACHCSHRRYRCRCWWYSHTDNRFFPARTWIRVRAVAAPLQKKKGYTISDLTDQTVTSTYSKVKNDPKPWYCFFFSLHVYKLKNGVQLTQWPRTGKNAPHLW